MFNTRIEKGIYTNPVIKWYEKMVPDFINLVAH